MSCVKRDVWKTVWPQTVIMRRLITSRQARWRKLKKGEKRNPQNKLRRGGMTR